MKNPWTDGELQYLRRSWPDLSDEQIAKNLRRSLDSVRSKRYTLGIRLDPADWSPEEDSYILEHWDDQTDEEIAKALKRAPHAVYQRGLSLGMFRRKNAIKGNRTWTTEEITYLRNSWGEVSVKSICKHLNRTKAGVLNKCVGLGLGPYLEHSDYITMHQLLSAFCSTSASDSYKLKSWVENRGFPVKTKLIDQKRVRIVYLDEFWEWAEKNRSFLDFSKMEPLTLGAEPDWVAEQRRNDFRAFSLQRKDSWTSNEDERLIRLLKMHKYGYAELSEMLHRSAGAIQRRCNDLGIKERPVKADNHSKESRWTDEAFEILAGGIRHGESYTEIGRKLGKSEKAIRGKVYTVYFTEQADKIRRMMGDGPWGSGAPEPTVKQAIHLSGVRVETKSALSALCGALNSRVKQMKSFDYDHYFQRAMCVHWDDIHGVCGAGCEDCDDCTEFIRIRPQYCIRCGATFYERRETRFCAPCRTARKKAAQRKYMKLRKD